ncbi:MAG: hypothetical protein AB7F19_06910 [Candidatus Babeliales bacterium]
MNILKHMLFSVTLVGLIVAPYAHGRPGPNGTPEPVITADNPQSFVESIGFITLFLAAAYMIHKIIPPLTPEEQDIAKDAAVFRINTPENTDAWILENESWEESFDEC